MIDVWKSPNKLLLNSYKQKQLFADVFQVPPATLFKRDYNTDVVSISCDINM